MAIRCPRCRSENPDTSKFCGACAAALEEAAGPPSLTKTFTTPAQGMPEGTIVAGKYRIVNEIGRGGMGIVYRAEDTSLQRTVALKFLPPQWTSDPQARERFVHEARAASSLDHPNICTIHEIGETEDGRMFIAMGCYEGESLRDKLRPGPLEIKDALSLASQIAMGMAKAHAKGIVHRDIKPANILVTTDGVAKIVDFGLAKLAGQVRMTKEGLTVGTAAYMSPEQAKGEEVDQRTDIWSLGVVLFEMLAGRLPFQGDHEQGLIHSILKAEPDPIGTGRKDLPKGLESVVLKALEKDPSARYQTMDALLQDLQAVAEGLRPLGAGSRLFRGRFLGVRKVYAYAGLAGLGILTLAFALNIGGLRRLALGGAGPLRITSLAVMPVKDYSGDPAQKLYGEGMTDALINGLAGITALSKVTARTSAMQYEGTTKSWPQVGKELGVDAIVEASVTRSGGSVGIKARLFETRQGRQVGTPIAIELKETDVLVLQSELVRTIVREIKLQVTPQEARRLEVARTIAPEVYDATLQGKALIDHTTREAGVRQAIGLFKKAVEQDPGYALAWAGLGEAYWCLAVSGFEFVPPAEVRGQAIEAAEKALELDETLPEAHKARAVIALDGEWDVVKAQRHFERALELRPSYASAHTFYGQMLVNPLLRFDEARKHLDRARELDPLLVTWNDANLLTWWQIQGQPGKALEEGERARLRNPGEWLILDMIGDAQLLLGQPSQAVREYEAALGLLSPDRPATELAVLGLAYGLAGRQAEALNILAEMERASREHYVSPLFLAVANSGLARMDEAFRLLDRALELRVPYLVGLTPYSDMVFGLRRDSRWKPFAERLRRLVKLPPGTPNPYS